MNDLISVIVPVYNVENYIEDCINSISNQTYKNIEIIAINDGSRDNSLEKLEKATFKEKRLRIISQINKGLSGARNRGIEEAKGKYLFFLDSDDRLNKNTILENLYQSVVKNDADLGITNYVTLNEKTLKILPKKINLSKEIYTQKEFLDELLDKNKSYYSYIPAWNKLYKKEIFEKLKFKENIYYEDTEIFSKIILHSNKIVFYNDFGVEYKISRKGSITTNSNKINDILKVADEIEKFYLQLDDDEKKKIEKLIKFLLQRIYLTYFLSLRKNKFILCDIKRGVKLYKESLKKSIIYEKLDLKNKILSKSRSYEAIVVIYLLNKFYKS